jgi:hypothetical protein
MKVQHLSMRAKNVSLRRVLRVAAIVGASSMIVALGIPQIAGADGVTITGTVDLSGVDLSSVETSINNVIGQVNPLVAEVGTDLSTTENTLLSDAGLSQAELGALTALALIEKSCAESGQHHHRGLHRFALTARR